MFRLFKRKDFKLVLATLTTESSYTDEIERPASNVADTVQFWISPSNQWRIRTFAIDHDIHIYKLNSATEEKFNAELAFANIKNNYSDVISKIEIIEFTNPNDDQEVKKTLSDFKLKGTLEVAQAGFAFYNPDKAKYSTKSNPK